MRPRRFAHDVPKPPATGGSGLLDAVMALKPTVLIGESPSLSTLAGCGSNSSTIAPGVSAQPNTFTQDVCEAMSANHTMPLIFALSNPTSKAECSAKEAYTWTNGNCVYASGYHHITKRATSTIITFAS
jgi:malic enzyme